MDPPMGYRRKWENIVCKLHKSIYCLKQASRQWFTKFSQLPIGCGFTQSKSDYSLFTKGSGVTFVSLDVYVDNIIIASPNLSLVRATQKALQKLFCLKLLGNLRCFLGLEIAKSFHGIYLSQRKYTPTLLEDSGFFDSKGTELPRDPNLKFPSIDGATLEGISQYRGLIGRLLYFTISRPEICFVVNKLCRIMLTPTSVENKQRSLLL